MRKGLFNFHKVATKLLEKTSQLESAIRLAGILRKTERAKREGFVDKEKWKAYKSAFGGDIPSATGGLLPSIRDIKDIATLSKSAHVRALAAKSILEIL